MKNIPITYTFNAAAKTVTCSDFQYLERIYLIQNLTTGQTLYDFGDTALSGTLVDTVLTLIVDTTGMTDSDELKIMLDNNNTVDELKALSDSINYLVQTLAFLPSVRGTAADLRVTLLSGTLSTITTVTTVGTVSNQTSMGGYVASSLVQSSTNTTAILANINNII